MVIKVVGVLELVEEIGLRLDENVLPELITVLKVVGALGPVEEVVLEPVKGAVEVIEGMVLRLVLAPKFVGVLDKVEIPSLELAVVLEPELAVLELAVLELAVLELIVFGL